MERKGVFDIMDQCTHCTLKGDLKGCLRATCSYHDLWIVKEIRKVIEGRLLEDLLSTPEPLPEEEKEEIRTWKRCPNCNGRGTMSQPPWIPANQYRWTSTSATLLCQVCRGCGLVLISRSIK
jgi:hypothetical protein